MCGVSVWMCVCVRARVCMIVCVFFLFASCKCVRVYARQINSLNAAALRMYGYTNRDVVGRNISALIPEPFATLHNK